MSEPPRKKARNSVLEPRTQEAHESKSVYDITPADDDDDPYPQMLSEDIIAKFPFRMIICGDSQSGKSTMFVNLLTKFFFPFFDYIFGFIFNHDVDPLWKQLCNKIPNKLDKDRVAKDYTSEALQKILDWVRENFTTRQASAKVLIILDDQAGNRDCMQDPLLGKMNMWMRHLNVSTVLLSQVYMKIQKAVRTQASILAFFNTKNQTEFETIEDEVCPSWIPRKRFREVYNLATVESYCFMYVKNDEKDPHMRFRKCLTELIVYDEKLDPIALRAKGINVNAALGTGRAKRCPFKCPECAKRQGEAPSGDPTQPRYLYTQPLLPEGSAPVSTLNPIVQKLQEEKKK